jgi:uncharacterized protein YbjT (DUF2867 family)
VTLPVVAVAGATGALGSQICRVLRERGATVRALSRPQVDLREPSTLGPALPGVNCVVSTATCFPRTNEIDEVDREGNLALVDAAEAAGVERFVFVSFRPVPLDFPLQRAKRAVEERLESSSLDAVVLRPGKFMDIWFSSIVGFDGASRTATLYGDGTTPVTWIAARDVAEIAARAATADVPPGTYELGGPEALSQRDVVSIYEEVTGERWQTETLPVEELQRLHELGETAVIRSLGALMLETHLGATTDPATFLDTFPLRLTTVRQFAQRQSASD